MKKTLLSALIISSIFFTSLPFGLSTQAVYANEITNNSKDTLALSRDDGYSKASDFTSFAMNDNIFVAISNDGQLLTTADKINWTKKDVGTKNCLLSIVWGKDRFVAVGEGGTILTSADGVQWATAEKRTESALSTVKFEGDQFISFNTNGTILTSADGEKWTLVSDLSTEYDFNDISWDGKRFVALDKKLGILTSEDCKSWAEVSYTNDYKPDYINEKIIYNGSKFVAVGTKSRTLKPPQLYLISQVSEDGENWACKDAYGITSYGITSYGINCGNIYYFTWTGTNFVMINSYGVCYSDDGISWRYPNTSRYDYFGSHLGLFYKNQYFFINEHTITSTTDRINWKIYISANDYTKIGDTFIRIFEDRLITSKDGAEWTYTPLNFKYEDITTATNGEVFAILISGYEDYIHGSRILTSTDGVNWKEVYYYKGYLTNIVWEGNKFICIGYNGIIVTSEDGVKWNTVYSEEKDRFRRIAYNGSVYLIYSDEGKLIKSYDCVNWITVKTNLNPSNRNIVFDGKVFITTQSFYDRTKSFFSSYLLTSYDGITWEKRAIFYGTDIKYITSDGKRVYAEFADDTYSMATIINAPKKINIRNDVLDMYLVPEDISGTFYIPVKSVFRRLGYNVEINEDSSYLTASKDNSKVEFFIKSYGSGSRLQVNNKSYLIQDPIIPQNRDILISVNDLSKITGMKIDWDKDKSVIYIKDVNNAGSNCQVYEAEDCSDAVIWGGAEIYQYEVCSNNGYVGWLGKTIRTNNGTVEFDVKNIPSPGYYKIGVYYLTNGDNYADVSINLKPKHTYQFESTGSYSDAVGVKYITVYFDKTGSDINYLIFDNENGIAPNIDRITVSKAPVNSTQE